MRPTSYLFFLACLLIVFWGGISLSMATTLVVTVPADAGNGTLRQAVTDAASGDTILVQTGDTIKLDSQILILGKALTILGEDARIQVVSGQGKGRMFEVLFGGRLTLSHLSLVHGQVDPASILPVGGAIASTGSLTLSNCIFAFNKAVDGGAIHLRSSNDSTKVLSLENCTFYGNEATLENSGFGRNGGAINCDARGQGAIQVIGQNVTLVQNVAHRSGGAIYMIAPPAGGAQFRCTSCTISDNTADLCGGVDHSEAENAETSHSILTGNHGREGFEDFFGGLISQGHNLIGNNGNQSLRLGPNDSLTRTPLLGSFGDGGGELPVQFLLCGSPAIDRGDVGAVSVLDARGIARVGPADYGAYDRDETVDLAIISRSDDGFGSLRRAVVLSCPYDTLSLGAISDTVGLKSPLEIIHPLALSAEINQGIFLDGQLQTRIIDIQQGQSFFSENISYVRGNADLYGGGAIRNLGELTVHQASFFNNQATSGGAIATYGVSDSAYTRLVNCTFARNEARDLDGGAIDLRAISDSAILELSHVSLLENKATNRGGGIHNQNGRVIIDNSLLANSTAMAGTDGFGAFQPTGPNAFGVSASIVLSDQAGQQLDIDPVVGPLSLAPDAKVPTYRLLPGSPLIDVGILGEIDLDQIGRTRPIGSAPDIGAIEFEPLLSIPSAGLDWKIYPNPTTSTLFLQGKEAVSPTLSLYNVQGQRVIQQQLDCNQGTCQVELGDLSTGIYLLKIRAGWGATYQTRIMIR